MKISIKNTIVALLTALLPISVPAADLPTIPASKNISAGTLANGVNYYIITNSSYKGMADIALVQKAGSADEAESQRGSATVNARASLSDLQHFTQDSPFAFLRGKAVHPARNGYVKVGPDASIYRFENLVKDRKTDIVDSTLLLIFDIIGREGGKMGELYTPENQAIIISGDINESEIRGKMDMLSMFIAKRQGPDRSREYSWEDKERTEVKTVHSWSRNTISAEYRYPRTPEADMATVLPLVTSRYASELEILLRKRLSRALRKDGIPYSSIDFSYESSADRYGDELFRVSISTGRDNLEAATKTLARTLSEIDAHGASPAEFSDIENELMLRMSDRFGSTVIENSRYVDKCISSFLYGASLASDLDNLRFFSSRNLNMETSARLFSNFVAALLDRTKNLSLICETQTDASTAQAISKAFDGAWASNPKHEDISFSADTTSLRKPSGKAKIRLITPEPLFGGEMWTFTNGMKVIYKKVANGGYIDYSWLIKGGFSSMQNLRNGESAYLGDILGTYKIGGLRGSDFEEMLHSNGVTMDISTSLSDISISGKAKAARLQLLMKSLLSMASGRDMDADAYSYFRKCEELKAAEPSMEARLDSIMHREALFSDQKRAVKLPDDFQTRADKFYDEMFSRGSEAVLIIVGDIDENLLKKTMLQYIGSFKAEKAYTYRSRNKMGTITSRKTAHTWGREPGVGISMSAPINYTADYYMAANIAAIAMRDAVGSAISQAGWTYESEQDIRMFPEECLTLDFMLSQASADGLPASMMREDSAEVVLSIARKAITDLGEKGISDSGLKVGKAILYNYFESWKSDPKTMAKMLVLRYSYGKDIVTDYKSKISAVSADRVNPILKALASGGIAEYVVAKSRLEDFREVPVEVTEKLYIPPMAPVPGSLYYPYDGSTVPADSTVDVRDIVVELPTLEEFLISIKEAPDTAEVCPEDGEPLEEAPAGNEEAAVSEAEEAPGEEKND